MHPFAARLLTGSWDLETVCVCCELPVNAGRVCVCVGGDIQT